MYDRGRRSIGGSVARLDCRVGPGVDTSLIASTER